MNTKDATEQAQQRTISMEELETVLDEILGEYAGFHVRYSQGARDTVEQVRIRLGISSPKCLEQLTLRKG